MQKTKFIDDLVLEAIQYLSSHSYSARTIYFYKRIWEKFATYAKEKDINYYSSELGMDFFYHFSGTNPNKKLDKYQRSYFRVMKVLDDISFGKKVKAKYCHKDIWIPKKFEKELNAYKDHLIKFGQKQRTIETKVSRVLVFLRFLDEKFEDLMNIDFQTLEKFYKYISKNYSTNAQSNIKFTLRDFLSYAESQNFVPKNITMGVGIIYSNKHERLPSTYTPDEINRILSSVDRNTNMGKRNYAILLLIAQLGLRSSDVCSLTLDSLQFEHHCIVFKQQKTGAIEKLPTTKLLEYAIADYLKNARPKTDSNFLFLHLRAKNRDSLTGTAIYTILNKYMRKSGIETSGKRHGPHSIRHSLSSILLKEGVELPVISKILGHSSIEITTRYLWMDTEQLRKLSLEVPYEE